MNCYGRVSDLKVALAGTGSSLDARYLALLERVSRQWDTMLDRHFYALDAQTLLLPEQRRPSHTDQRRLWLPFDVVSITSLKVDEDHDGTFEKTLALGTDFYNPYNVRSNEPIQCLEIDEDSTQIAEWPSSPRRIQLVGVRGYSRETQQATTLAAEVSSTTATSLTTAASPDLSPGDTVIIDDEQMDVTAVDGVTITVARGINGSTAATHANASVVYRRRFPRDIEAATVMQASRMYRAEQSGGADSLGNADFGAPTFSALYPMIRDLIEPYRFRGIN